jgi:exodeoxyribonuclease V alpha subunit
MAASYFSGRVSSVIFENESQGFYILKMVLDGRTDTVSVKGTVLGITIEVGSWFGFDGVWATHETHGKQIDIVKAPVVKEWTPEVVASVLAANGVGERIVSHVRAFFGERMVEVLDQFNPVLLEEVPGLDPLAAELVIKRWKLAKAYFRTLEFLAHAGVPRRQVSQVWSMFGDDAEDVLSRNPWALVRIDGISFAQADDVAEKLKLPRTSTARVEGAVRFACKTRKGLGHLYLTSGEIFAESEALLGGTVAHAEVAHAIVSLHKQKHLVVDGATRPGLKAIYEPWLYKVERDGAEFLLARTKSARLDRDDGVLTQHVAALGNAGSNATTAAQAFPSDLRGAAVAALQDWSLGSQINLSLSGKQLQGVVNALTEPVSIVTGLPGTGKSTLLKAVVSILKDAGETFLLVAPTGIAAKRITAVAGAPAATIHRAFGAQGWNKGKDREASYVGITGQSQSNLEGSDGSGEEWECTATPHRADVVIVDEASMVDQHLLYRILTCSKPTTRLVFIGDAQQLPSVGPGNVLRDMIASGLFPTVALTDIYRQADTSQIVTAAHAISRGDVPPTGEDLPGEEFVFIHTRSEEQVLEVVTRLATKLYEERANFQVMSPRHSGVVGVTNLNAKLREPLNPKRAGVLEMRIGSETIREDDRVMVIRNNYEEGKEIFNGDVGKVHRLDKPSKIVEIKIHGPPIQYVKLLFKEAADYLRLAYCTTVHKMQGQEADTIIIPLITGFGLQLQRNLLYTAITRARKKVYIVGHHEAFVRAIANNRQDERNTLFLDRLRALDGGSTGGRLV